MKAAVLLLALLAGCASMPDGVTITDEERVTCKRDGCTVWSEQELISLVRMAIEKGYEAGKASTRGGI